METQGREIHIERDEARAGSTPRVVRYVLFVSIALAIIALSAIWITGAATSDGNTGSADTAQVDSGAGQPAAN